MNRYFHSVRLDRDKCRGCTNCIKHCPTEAIRVRGGKAQIIAERCIDCGECIRVCPYHAKIAYTDPLSDINRFKYKIALPAPSLYGQFKALASVERVLVGLKLMGFDEVYEVARGADVVSCALRERLSQKSDLPVISSACPAVVRLIQVRFPNLIDNIIDLQSPMEVAASAAKSEYAKKMGIKRSDIGAFFITPCPAKMTAIKNPYGAAKSEVDGAISVIDIYGLLSGQLKKPGVITESGETASVYGVGWANSGGECSASGSGNCLAVDGISNVIKVLEEIENMKLTDLEFFEGLACPGGCVGGPLTFENPFVARTRIRKLAAGIKKGDLDAQYAAKYIADGTVDFTQPIDEK
jgi:iron only hydrogenase large subunit-like protein